MDIFLFLMRIINLEFAKKKKKIIVQPLNWETRIYPKPLEEVILEYLCELDAVEKASNRRGLPREKTLVWFNHCAATSESDC